MLKKISLIKGVRDDDQILTLTNRLFRLKVKEFLHDLQKKQIFGRVIGLVWVQEYRMFFLEYITNIF